MNKAVMEALVKALQSEKYIQCTSVLSKAETEHSPQQHCCLGVLCQIAVEAGAVPAPTEFRDGNLGIVLSWEGAKDILPDSVKAWAGLRSNTGQRSGGELSLAMLNDGGMPFVRIAEIIEKEWHTL